MSAKVLAFDPLDWPRSSPCHLIDQILEDIEHQKNFARFGKDATPDERWEALELAYDLARFAWHEIGRAKQRQHLLSQGERCGLVEATYGLARLEDSLEAAWSTWLQSYGTPCAVLVLTEPLASFELAGAAANEVRP